MCGRSGSWPTVAGTAAVCHANLRRRAREPSAFHLPGPRAALPTKTCGIWRGRAMPPGASISSVSAPIWSRSVLPLAEAVRGRRRRAGPAPAAAGVFAPTPAHGGAGAGAPILRHPAGPRGAAGRHAHAAIGGVRDGPAGGGRETVTSEADVGRTINGQRAAPC